MGGTTAHRACGVWKMAERLPTRDEALALLKQYNKNEALIRHALAVEAVMRVLRPQARSGRRAVGRHRLGPRLGLRAVPRAALPQERADPARAPAGPRSTSGRSLSHGWGICTEVEPKTDLEKTLYAMDELTGLVAATAIVRPSKSVLDMEPKSVKKKWKEKSFAAGVNREVIEKGAALLGVDLNELIGDAIRGMREAAGPIGLAGNPARKHERESVKRET